MGTLEEKEQGQEEQAKFRCEMLAERCPGNIQVEAPSWSTGEKTQGHRDQTGLSGTGEHPGSGWAHLGKSRDTLELSHQTQPFCLSSPPPPISKGGLDGREELRTGFQENHRFFQ